MSCRSHSWPRHKRSQSTHWVRYGSAKSEMRLVGIPQTLLRPKLRQQVAPKDYRGTRSSVSRLGILLQILRPRIDYRAIPTQVRLMSAGTSTTANAR